MGRAPLARIQITAVVSTDGPIPIYPGQLTWHNINILCVFYYHLM